jgi:hypothetical protein
MFPGILVFLQVDSFDEQVDDNYGNQPSQVKIEVKNRHAENKRIGLVKDMDKRVIHHDYAKNEKDDPALFYMQTPEKLALQVAIHKFLSLYRLNPR